MRSRSAALTWPTHRYCSTASVGSSTSKATVRIVSPEGRFIRTARTITREKWP